MPDADALATRPIELLAPAGDRDSLVAAVRNGADAVYVGLHDFNARRGAANFSLLGLREACDFAHLRGVRVYLTANILILSLEAQEALSLVDSAWAAGVDGVIIQDLGLVSLVTRFLPHVRIHASTQVGAHNVETVELLADLGVERVTLARELSIEEVSHVSAMTDVETESFVHGSLCVCYSGQCLLSSLIGGRSANRGLCTQPCRLPYSLLDPDGVEVETDGRYLLSPKDLAGAALLPSLVGSGLSALKIEGRMKSPEYVALVVGSYRAALDRAIEDPEGFVVTDGEGEVLEEAFNRGFTEGYLSHVRDDRLMGYQRPNNRGVRIGRVVSVHDRTVTIRLDRAVDPEDRIEFWTRRGRFAQSAGPLTVGGTRMVTAHAGADVVLHAEGPVSGGDRVFRIENAHLLAAARRTFSGVEERRPVPAGFRVDVRVGEPLRVTVATAGVTAMAEGEIVEPARTKPITAEEVIEHVGRLGGTPYAAASWDVRLDAAAGLGYSALHRVRREAVEHLSEMQTAAYHARRETAPTIPVRHTDATRSGRPDLVAVTADLETAEACIAAGADRALLEVDPLDDPVPLPERIGVLLPRVAHDAEIRTHGEWAETGMSIAAGNLGTLRMIAGTQCIAEAGWALNIANPYTAEVLASEGAALIWASPELSATQITDLVASSPVPVGVSVLGAQELMVTEHCVLQASGRCRLECAACDRRRETWWLEDRKGYRLPVRSDGAGRSHVYNPHSLDLTRALGDVLDTGAEALRLDLVLYGAKEATDLTVAVRRRIDAAVAGAPSPKDRLLDPATGGCFFREVE